MTLLGLAAYVFHLPSRLFDGRRSTHTCAVCGLRYPESDLTLIDSVSGDYVCFLCKGRK